MATKHSFIHSFIHPILDAFVEYKIFQHQARANIVIDGSGSDIWCWWCCCWSIDSHDKKSTCTWGKGMLYFLTHNNNNINRMQEFSTGTGNNTIKSMQSFIEMKGSISLDGVGRTRLRYRYEYMLKIVVWYYGSRSEQSTRIHIYRIYIRWWIAVRIMDLMSLTIQHLLSQLLVPVQVPLFL